MSDSSKSPISLSIDDVPGGTGPRKLAQTDDLARPGSAPASPLSGAAMVGYDDGTSGLPADTVQEAIDQLALGVGGTTRWFYIDNQITDSPAYASVGIFHDDGSCMAWVELNLPPADAIVLQFSPTDALNPHIMSNGSTWGANGQREVVYHGTGNEYYSYLSIDSDVTLPAADPFFYPSITFKDIQVIHSPGAKLKLGAFRQFLAFNCSWSGSNTPGAPADLYGDDADFTFNGCGVFRVQIDRDPLNVAGTGVSGRFVDCAVDVARDQILVDHAYYGISFEIASVRLNATTVAVSPKLARTVAGGGMVASSATFRNTDLYLICANGATPTIALDFGVGLSLFNAFGLTIMPSIAVFHAAALTTGFTAINTVPGPFGLDCYRNNLGVPLFFSGSILLNEYAQMLVYTAPAMNVPFPGFLVPVQVPFDINDREVSVTCKLVSAVAATGDAGAALEVETGYLSGTYAEVACEQIGFGTVHTDFKTMTVPVKGGLRYQLRDVSGAAGSASVEAKSGPPRTGYSYTDR